MYDALAGWWPLLSPPSEYAEEAAFYRTTLEATGAAPLRSMLELGSGGGSNAWHLKDHFDMVLTDVAPAMLDVSRAVNPECTHVEGDMRTLRLGREFDCVFVHDAIMFMTTERDLLAAMQTAFVHCRPGGVALFAPDCVRETFRPATDCGGHDGPDRALRYLEWSWDPDPGDTTCVVDYVLTLRSDDGSVRVEHDRHVEGVFPRSTWIKLLGEAGFTANVVPFRHSEVGYPLEVFVARRPG